MFSSSRNLDQGQLFSYLVDQLGHADAGVRLGAIQSLGMLPNSECLLIQMLGDDSWQVRQAAVAKLAQCQEPAIAPLLINLLRQHHHNPGVVDSVLRILRLSSLNVIPLLLECATDGNTDLRIYAMTALGEQQDVQAFTALIQGLADADMNVRYHAIESLGRQRNAAAVEALIAIAESQELFLAFPALDALAQIGDVTVVPRLLPLLNDDTLALPTIATLGSLGDMTAIPALAQLLEHPQAPIEAVGQAIAQLYQTSLMNGQTRLTPAEWLKLTLTDVHVQKLIPMVTQWVAPDVRPDTMAVPDHKSDCQAQSTDTGVIV